MQFYTPSLTQYKRLQTKEVTIGTLKIGNMHPIRIQTMTTTDTMDTQATVDQCIRCIKAGAELIRITAPSKNEAENLRHIKHMLRAKGYDTPIIADIHFTPNAAEIAATIVEKVRINPGNYVDKKKFEQIEYTDEEYEEEIERITQRFTPLVKICKAYGTAMRIGTNHGSLSDRIMSRFGDTAIGMVESALEFLRIARNEDYHNIILSMKSSNPQVMVQAYRLLIHKMQEEFGECYPLHLGVTEAGDGEDGRIKSAIGIGTLLEDGIGDTIRVSLTEEPEAELPVCQQIIAKYSNYPSTDTPVTPIDKLGYDPFTYTKNNTTAIQNIGASQVPVVIADASKIQDLQPTHLESMGYTYTPSTDKWLIGDMAADYIFCNQVPAFDLPGTLGVITYYNQWLSHKHQPHCYPLYDVLQYLDDTFERSTTLNFVMLDCFSQPVVPAIFIKLLDLLKKDATVVLCLSSTNKNAMQSVRRMCIALKNNGVQQPVIFMCDSMATNLNNALVQYATEAGALLIDGFTNGISLGYQFGNNNFGTNELNEQHNTLNSIAFGILQATRTRISKTEYISCPSCGRTLFNLQETTAQIRAVTHHLKGVKIAIMGCIVNGPGEMADADFGYVGSGVGKITLYKNKEVVKKNIPADIAVAELIQLIKENGAWVDAH